MFTALSFSFIISNGGGTQTFHLRANSEKERQKWITALELAKARGLRSMNSEEDEDLEAELGETPGEITKQELNTAVKALGVKLEDLDTCANLIGKHGSALIGSLNALNLDKLVENAPPEEKAAVKEKVKAISERAALLKLTSAAMIKASGDFLKFCKNDGRKWQRIMENEREIRQRYH